MRSRLLFSYHPFSDFLDTSTQGQESAVCASVAMIVIIVFGRMADTVFACGSVMNGSCASRITRASVRRDYFCCGVLRGVLAGVLADCSKRLSPTLRQA
jgi:hypothetical protein